MADATYDSHKERFDAPSKTWACPTHKQVCLQAITVSCDVRLEDVLDVCVRARRPKLVPPAAQAGRASARAEGEATSGERAAA
jgi:hypothetical protein